MWSTDKKLLINMIGCCGKEIENNNVRLSHNLMSTPAYLIYAAPHTSTGNQST